MTERDKISAFLNATTTSQKYREGLQAKRVREACRKEEEEVKEER
jgi:hypothetical protein|tara:strand:+ start:134 stop:268 length:135 start_codon:yes stop_codon:yes gene_type:complete